MNRSRHAIRWSPIHLAVATALAGSAGLAQAQSLQDLAAQIEALKKEVGDLKKQQGTAPATGAVTAGAAPGSFKLPGSNTSATIGGYVKLDALYSSRSAGVNNADDQLLNPSGIPLSSANEKKQLTLHARQSRFFLKTSTPSALGDINTHLEFDLFGGSGNESVSNSHNLRLRHAYGTIGGFLAGQTWSNFMAVGALPETLDFGGPVGQLFVRQAQVRWTQPIAGGQFAVALENPESVLTNAAGANTRADDDRYPDLTGNFGFKTSLGAFNVTGLLRQVRIDTGAVSDDKFGGGIAVHGVIPTNVGKNTFNFSGIYGNAVGRYFAGQLTDGFLSPSNSLKLPTQYGGFVSYHHFWTDQLRSTVVLSALHLNTPSFSAGSTNKDIQTVHANLLWSPAKNTTLGAEYIYGHRKTKAGAIGALNRIQTSAQFNF